MIRRTTIVIDEDRLAAAQEALGTTGIKDTYDRALDEVVGRHRRLQLVEWVREGMPGLDLGVVADRDVMWNARRPSS